LISRGQVYFVDMSPTRGREQAGRRPVLVISADLINRQPLVVAVVVGTDARNVPRDYPTNVRVPAAESGQPIDTVFLCFQLRSPDPARFLDPASRQLRPAGVLPERRMTEVDQALRLVLDL
jgi:mRNA interferase MazF